MCGLEELGVWGRACSRSRPKERQLLPEGGQTSLASFKHREGV